jgi:hypothetical protein
MAIQLYGLMLPSSAERMRSSRIEVAGTTVRLLACDDLFAIVGDAPPPETSGAARPTLEDVRRHDAVLQAAVGTGATVAAARFGQHFADDAACCADVRAKSERLHRVLEQYDGHVEMRLLTRARAMAPTQQPASAAAPGRAYLEQLRGEEARLASQSVKDALGSVVRAEVVSRLPHDAIVIAHLVRAQDVDAYRAAVARHPHLSDARIVGPLPLYSFTDV